jgi:hypothetical protein
MAIQQRKRANIVLTFKVLHFINQLRRKMKPRVLGGLFDASELGSNVSGRQKFAARRIPSRMRKRHGSIRTPWPRAPRAGQPASSNQAGGEEVQQYVETNFCFVSYTNRCSMLVSADARLGSPGSALSAIAGSEKLFLKHDISPILECSSNKLVRLLAAAQEAVQTLADCRLQYGDGWLVAQGHYNGLVLDENFMANYEHLLLWLQAELVEALACRALEELLHGRYNKKQQKLQGWFTEFAEKPRPLGSSFPWTIKPSLAVLWGVSQVEDSM